MLYLHACWIASHNARQSSSPHSARTKVSICDNGYPEFSEKLAPACELMGYELIDDSLDADLVFVYIAPPSEQRHDRSQYDAIERVAKSKEHLSPDEQPIICCLLGDAAFLETPKEDEAERLRGLSDFAISQQLRLLVESVSYGSVAQFAVEFVPSHTANLSDDFKAEKDEQLSELMDRFGVLDKNLMHQNEKWEFFAPKASVFCHEQDDVDGLTNVGAEESAFWFNAAENHTCDQCHAFTDKLSRCARCHDAVYCSRECQKTAWKLHKQVCQKPK